MERGWGRVVNITSQSVKAPIATLGLSNSARAGLTGYVAGTSRQVAHSGVTINNLLPGSHATDRIKNLLNSSSQKQGVSVEDLRKELEASIPAKRLGTHTEFGEVCAQARPGPQGLGPALGFLPGLGPCLACEHGAKGWRGWPEGFSGIPGTWRRLLMEVDPLAESCVLKGVL